MEDVISEKITEIGVVNRAIFSLKEIIDLFAVFVKKIVVSVSLVGIKRISSRVFRML